MKKLALAAALLCGVASTAYALDASVMNGTQSDISGAVTAMQGSKDALTSLQGLKDIKSVKIVKLDNNLTSDTSLVQAMSKNQADLNQVNTAIEANPTLKAALDAQKITADQIVAVDVAASGDVTIYAKG
jgi:hypothetical protein